LTLLLVLMAATVVLAPVAERIAIPYPVLLLMFGLVLAFVPDLPLPTVNPELLLPLVLPPLLFAAGQLQVLIGQAAIVTAVVILVRCAWIFPVTFIDEKARRRRNDDLAEPVGWREMTVASWAGMRGVVTLVAALALPPTFPERDRLIFIAFIVISVTLLLQGLRARRCGQELLRRARDAGFQRLDELREQEDVDADVIEQARETPTGCGTHSDTRPTAATTTRRAARRAAPETRSSKAGPSRRTDPTIADAVLRRPDSRGTHPE
jgi:CPA1 family monovalent cation:H+ antiporter